MGSGIVCSGSKNPIAMVVVTPEWQRAINLAGEEIPIAQYLEELPKLKELLRSI